MKFSALLALPAIATALSVRNNWKDNNCLTDADAAYLISQSTVYLEHHDVAAAKAAAYSIFTEDIAEFGDSINALKGDALGTQVENGLTQYVNETTGSPPINKITTLDSFHSCDKVLWQWQFDLGLPAPSPNFHINGVTIMKVNSDKKIYYQYIEFNSLTWAIDIGFTVKPPASIP